MKTALCVVQIIGLLFLAGCAQGQGSPPAPSVPALPASSESAPPAAGSVEGRSLEEMGYSIDYSAVPPELRERLERESGSQPVKQEDNWVDGIRGNYTKVYLYMNYLYGSDEVILCYLQAFPNEKTGPDARVKIGQTKHPFAGLKDNLVYQDSAVSVYNVFPLLDSYIPVADVIRETVDSVNSGIDGAEDWPPDREKPARLQMDDFNGVLELEAYYEENLSGMIARAAPERLDGDPQNAGDRRHS